MRAGAALNLVAFTRGTAMAETWSGKMDTQVLKHAMPRTAPRSPDSPTTRGVDGLADPHGATAQTWTAPGGIALIGDAAHAMTPYAAQGAAMAIEDAETLAGHVLAQPDSVAAALAAWEKERRQRIDRVARRGTFNRFAWHASGPVAMVRNIVLRRRVRPKSSPPTSTGSTAGNRRLSSDDRLQLCRSSDTASVCGSGFHQPVCSPASRSAAAVQVLQPSSAVK